MKEWGVDLQLEEPLGLRQCSGSGRMPLREPAPVVLGALRVQPQGPRLELLWYQWEQCDRFIYLVTALGGLKRDISCGETRSTGAATLRTDPGSVFIAKVFQVSYRLRSHNWFSVCYQLPRMLTRSASRVVVTHEEIMRWPGGEGRRAGRAEPAHASDMSHRGPLIHPPELFPSYWSQKNLTATTITQNHTIRAVNYLEQSSDCKRFFSPAAVCSCRLLQPLQASEITLQVLNVDLANTLSWFILVFLF